MPVDQYQRLPFGKARACLAAFPLRVSGAGLVVKTTARSTCRSISRFASLGDRHYAVIVSVAPICLTYLSGPPSSGLVLKVDMGSCVPDGHVDAEPICCPPKSDFRATQRILGIEFKVANLRRVNGLHIAIVLSLQFTNRTGTSGWLRSFCWQSHR